MRTSASTSLKRKEKSGSPSDNEKLKNMARMQDFDARNQN